MESSTGKTHADYLDIIGGTAFTTRTYREKRYNQYYFSSAVRVVQRLLADEKQDGRILDVGCSHGSWFGAWKALGFTTIHGVELSQERAAAAKQTGYDEVYCCDAQSMPLPDQSYTAASSSDMFVHLLNVPDKLAVTRECFRVLKPGGVFVVNFPPPLAFGYSADTVVKYCSFISLDTMIREVVVPSGFRLEDIKTTYYRPYNFISTLGRLTIMLPGGVALLRLNDHLFSRELSVERSATVYLKLRKPA